MLYEWESKGAYASSNGGFINIKDLYSTIGINGLNEAARFLGLEVSNNPEYIQVYIAWKANCLLLRWRFCTSL